jgi:hypothetical protein
MRKILLIAFSLLPAIAFAHPGIGIVKDSKGNIYYTDLKQVWKISTNGSRAVVVPHVHTHELYMDANDNLYGEHLWYNGEQLNTWGSYAWCLHTNGKLDTVVASHEGFLEEYSFCRDSFGSQYWAERFTVSRIKKKTPDGKITTIVQGRFKDIRWMHVTPAGVVYFVDLLDVYKIDQRGQLSLLVKGLARQPSLLSLHSARHSIFGIWLDEQNNIYAAVSSERTVKKITQEGKVSDVVYSLFPWSPVSGLFDEKGNLWLMEFNMLNETRVRKINAKELQSCPSKVKATAANKILPLGIAAGIIILTGVGIKRLIRRKV